MRLTEDSSVVVAEYEGKVVGFCGASLHRVIAGGQEKSLVLIGQLRSLAGHRGGLSTSMSSKTMNPYGHRNDSVQNFIAKGNTRMLERRNPRGMWSTLVHRAIIPCAQVAQITETPVGRPATKADADRIVGILNECHEKEELYLPYDVDSLTARLERAADLYSWENVWITDGAVLGVWPRAFTAIREGEGNKQETAWGLALDYGFISGAEEEFADLLKVYCGSLAENGTDQLSICTSEGSPNYNTLTKLGAELESFHLWIGSIPEPEGTAERGIYVDQIYF